MTLVQLAEACDVEGVLRELGALTPDERAAQAEALEARRAPMRAGWYHVPEHEKAAQLAAELGCRTDPGAAADWILRHENGSNVGRLPLGGVWMLDVVNLHPVAWRAELAAQLADRSTPGESIRSDLVEHLVHDTGCPVPTSDGFIDNWLRWRNNTWQHPAHLRGGPRPGASFLERLRADELTPTLLPLVLDRPGVDIGVGSFHYGLNTHGRPYLRENTRLGVLISLSEEGLVDRAALIRRFFTDLAADERWGWDATTALTELALTPAEHASVTRERVALAEPLLARLLQDGTRTETAPPLAYLRALALTPAENALALRDHVALLDLSSPVAGYAQEVLIGLDEARLLEPDVLTEVCERVLLRPEKKLVRAQLTRLDRAARRDPARAARTVLDASTAFDHRDVDLQERALDVIARHLGAAGDSVLPELRTAAARISPGLAARAAELLGTAPARLTGQLADQYADLLPIVPEPRPVPGPIETAVEVAEELAAVVASGRNDRNDSGTVTFERVLDGLVRHAHLDRVALALALQPVMRKEPREVIDFTPSDVYDVARALRGDEPRERAFTAHSRSSRPSPAGLLLRARLTEAMDIIKTGSQPFLLAVPTDATGALDAAVLVRRVSVLDGLGITPAPVDLTQALLRVTPTADAKVLGAAEELGSDAGQRLARWLREGGLPHWDSAPANWPDAHSGVHLTDWVSHIRPDPATGPPLLPAAEALIGPLWSSCLYDPMVPFWLAQLPHHRELVLARDYFRSRDSMRGWAHALPFAAESGGPAGFALHLALAYTLTYDQQGERDAAVDALLVLAARGQLNTELLGQQLAELLRHWGIEANRVTASLGTAAETGAYAVIWSVLETALPRLLGAPVVRGTGALLALGVECASRCAAKGEIPEVTATAARTGSSQLVKNARLLRDVLG
ncbi:hypothetical protein [Streptomyces sp. SID12488]|uniref:hypothetical protein n=1 Tax=Streptomyces sp. SID12488 TaxID=2706040 RepID=UPI0013DBD2BE|nr:hypothetical protein [Streptomyces sp. SID12488]NEA61606.1 hypothetical protein [Streptomyces sp. SID12488]